MKIRLIQSGGFVGKPKIAEEELFPKHFVDALVLHLLTGGKKDGNQFLLRFFAQSEKAVGTRILSPVHRRPLQRVVRIILVQPVEFVEHAGTFDFQRRDRPEQVP